MKSEINDRTVLVRRILFAGRRARPVEVDPIAMKPERCERCGATSFVPLSDHVCDPSAAAAYGKVVCMDCLWHGSSSVQELEAISPGGACKHYDPEFWQAIGWRRGWGDAAVMGLPESIEILRREDGERVEYLILGRKLRRPVKLWFDKGSGESWGSF